MGPWGSIKEGSVPTVVSVTRRTERRNGDEQELYYREPFLSQLSMEFMKTAKALPVSGGSCANRQG